MTQRRRPLHPLPGVQMKPGLMGAGPSSTTCSLLQSREAKALWTPWRRPTGQFGLQLLTKTWGPAVPCASAFAPLVPSSERIPRRGHPESLLRALLLLSSVKRVPPLRAVLGLDITNRGVSEFMNCSTRPRSTVPTGGIRAGCP